MTLRIPRWSVTTGWFSNRTRWSIRAWMVAKFAIRLQGGYSLTGEKIIIYFVHRCALIASIQGYYIPSVHIVPNGRALMIKLGLERLTMEFSGS